MFYLILFSFADVNVHQEICIKYSPDAVPPIHAVWSHVATDKDPSK